MKKLLSIILPEVDAGETENTPEEVEILSFSDDKSLIDAVKRAKGKFSLVARDDVECDLSDDFFKELDGANADIIKYGKGFLVKTANLRGTVNKYSNSCTDIYAVLSCKTAVKSDKTPFSFKTAGSKYSESDGQAIILLLEEFKKSKAKLSKEVYAIAFDEICERVIRHIALGLIAVREGVIKAEVMAEFDLKLKDNIVLYLAVEKRFSYENLKKTRERGYKTGFFTYKKLKKIYG